jgi:hypothetical protein
VATVPTAEVTVTTSAPPVGSGQFREMDQIFLSAWTNIGFMALMMTPQPEAHTLFVEVVPIFTETGLKLVVEQLDHLGEGHPSPTHTTAPNLTQYSFCRVSDTDSN